MELDRALGFYLADDMVFCLGEKHRRRRAVKMDAKQNALAVDTCIRALGQICQSHEQCFGAEAGNVWSMWLNNLPLKVNADDGKVTHAQLVKLVTMNHPALTAQHQQPKVMKVLAEIYKSRLTTKESDEQMAKAVATIGAEGVKAICSGLSERQQKKVEQMLKAGQASA